MSDEDGPFTEAMATDLKTQIRLQFDRLNQMRKHLANYRKDSNERKTRMYYKKKLERIEDLQHEFADENKAILRTTCNANEAYFKNKIADQFETLYLEVFCVIAEDFNTAYPPEPTVATTACVTDNNPQLQHTARRINVQVPHLSVPKFSGKIIDWPGFHDNFNRMFHLNPDLNAIQRFHFLKEALPEDKDVDIHQMAITEANYTVAWDLLAKRYHIPRIIFMHNMNTMSNLPVLAKERSEDIKRMLNVATVCINAMEKLDIPIRQCDHWIAHHLSTKLSKETHQAWEHHLGNNRNIPTFNDFEEFLNNRLVTLDVIENRTISFQPSCAKSIDTVKQSNSSKAYKRPNNTSKASVHHTMNSTDRAKATRPCPLCQGEHILRRCPTYHGETVYGRQKAVENTKVCVNCLGFHHISKCPSSRTCKDCGQRHHSSLHFPIVIQQQSTSSPVSSNVSNSIQHSPDAQHTSNNTTQHSSYSAHDECPSIVLLPTAMVQVHNPESNCLITLRALIDQGSEITLISEQAAQALQLKRKSTRASIFGIGNGTPNPCRYTVSCNLRSHIDAGFNLFVEHAYVLDTLTARLPRISLPVHAWPHTQDLQLADPTFFHSQRVDMILGADLLAQVILPEMRIGRENEPIAQRTVFGWMLSGKTSSTSSHHITARSFHVTKDLETLVQQFFDIEQVPEPRILSTEDQWCEDFYRKTHVRHADGKYMVRLPLKSLIDPTLTIGRSRQMALNRFHQLDRKLQRNPSLKEKYSHGIDEYFQLHQAVPVVTTEDQHCSRSTSDRPFVRSCVLPHHAVIKEDSLTTKVRIVFDASAKTSNGRSLNDILCIGPALQNDLSTVLLNWRLCKYVFCTDMQKMYRCIDMHPDDINYQRILWKDKDNNIREYCLNTVTFGTAPAPYLAIRTMQQLADDEKHRFPLAERVLKSEIYVDDILSGSHSIESTLDIRNQLIAALQSAKFELRKWSSNVPEILESIPSEHRAINPEIGFTKGTHLKTLGIRWQPELDAFTFKFDFEFDSRHTKRSILSVTARLFDPLGYITPVIMIAKTILKNIWNTKIRREDDKLSGLDWDETLPTHIEAQWIQFLRGLRTIHEVSIPRWLKYVPYGIKSIELHTFCDGSSTAYAANVYLRLQYEKGDVFTHLLVSKGKVTPTKPLTIPRTELCGAVLAVKLANWIEKTINVQYHQSIPTYYWTDATIVLYWINGDLNRWKTFVANRIGVILSKSSTKQWNHVVTDENPADCATRGLLPKQLANFELWWHGPKWLRNTGGKYPVFNLNEIQVDETHLESKPAKVSVHTTRSCADMIIGRYSSLNKLLRVMSYVIRFIRNLRSTREQRTIGYISSTEYQQSLIHLVRIVQIETFAKEYHLIKKREPLPHKNKLSKLTPFIDDDKVLRVRGRLQRSRFPYQRKHPMILPAAHPFTWLVIENSHQNTLHGGIQLTLTNLRYRFWVIDAKRTVQAHIRKCVKCFRNSPIPSKQLMGNLPEHRVNPPKRAFTATGIDFTGAIELKSSRYRGHTAYKGYIAIFICLATKAIHLEAVTGMSTTHFLWAFQRFMGRRGISRDIYSDCGTNFVGAEKILRKQCEQFIHDMKIDVLPVLAINDIRWHFNPPHSPNFGGLWEANVKSVKHHLKRITDGNRLTYEELATLLTRIEACLNSRPLCPLSADPEDLTALTPGHFLIGDSLLSPPEPVSANEYHIPMGKQYLELQRMTHIFWRRWSSDWLSHLQSRPKWRNEEPNLQLNDLALIRDDRFPPNKWNLGRIIELHPGADGLVRVATLRTATGIYKRSISKLCRLPIPTYTAELEEQ